MSTYTQFKNFNGQNSDWRCSQAYNLTNATANSSTVQRYIVNNNPLYIIQMQMVICKIASTLLLRIQKEQLIFPPQNKIIVRKKGQGSFTSGDQFTKDEEEASGDKTEKKLIHYDFFYEQRPLR